MTKTRHGINIQQTFFSFIILYLLPTILTFDRFAMKNDNNKCQPSQKSIKWKTNSKQSGPLKR